MKREKQYAVLAVLAAAVCTTALSLVRVQADPSDSRTTLKIVLIDMPKLIRSLDAFKDYEAKQTDRKKQMEQVQRKLMREIEILDTEVKQLEVGTDERANKSDELIRKKQEFNLKMKQYNAHVARLANTFLENEYRNILKEVNAYAKENHIDFVLKTQRIDLEQQDTPVRMQLELNTILYAGPKADITDEIARRINKKYKAESGTK